MDQTGPAVQSLYRRLMSFQSGRAIFALMLREIGTTFGRSPGGYLWVIVEPLAGILLLTLAFTLLLRNPPLGTSFALFYATGLLPFSMYGELTMKIGQAIRFSRPLLTYPTVTFIDAILSRLLLNMLTQLVTMSIAIGSIVLVFDLRIDLDILRLANALGMMVVLCLGLGTLNCYLFGAFPVWERFWSILNRPLFLVSGVFFLVDSVPQAFRELLLLNPLTHVLAEVRAAFYPFYDGRYVSPLYVYTIGLTALLLGLLLLYRHHRFLISEGA